LVAGISLLRSPPEGTSQSAIVGGVQPSQTVRERAFRRWVRFEKTTAQNQQMLEDYFIDAVLGHRVFRIPPRGLPAHVARGLLMDDDQLLLSSGRRMWNRELLHQPGMAGRFCYLHSTYCLSELFEVSFFIDDRPVVIYDDQYEIERFPSHTLVRYRLPEIVIDERKFITYDDRAVVSYSVRPAGSSTHRLTLEASFPFPLVPGSSGNHSYPLLAEGSFRGAPIFIYADAPGFERVDARAVHLRKVLDVSPSGPASASLALSIETAKRPEGNREESDPFRDHALAYNRWFADNVPYFDASDPAFKKMWYYRWWIVRFHLVDASTPDLQRFAFYEGKLGFDNLITFAVPAQLKELTYLRDGTYGLSQAQNCYRNRARNGAIVDAPGSPYWGETYSHWTAMALAEFHRVHPVGSETLRELLPAVAADVRAWLNAYDADGDALPERDRPRVTGYDLDILSYWFFNGTRLGSLEPPALERVDFASFVFANAIAGAELAASIGEENLRAEFLALAERVRSAVLQKLWDDETSFFYPQRAADDARIQIRELHGFFPFTTLLAPDEARYLAALRKFVDPDEFWARFPPVITGIKHYKEWTWEMDGLTRNIAPHPISMGARTLLQVLKHYRQDAITADHFMELMQRYNDLVFPGVNPFDPLWRPNVHEYYSQWEPHSLTPRPKPSDISHDFHSMYCSLIVEGAVGLTPRADDIIELQPLARRWTHFLLDRLRYKGRDLTIVWDQPDGKVQYDGYPEGFSLFIDDHPAFAKPALGHILYDPATGEVRIVGDESASAN
jgi:hypothetical protein